jgi:hypothetical protein
MKITKTACPNYLIELDKPYKPTTNKHIMIEWGLWSSEDVVLEGLRLKAWLETINLKPNDV